jgi:hypothetical protein
MHRLDAGHVLIGMQHWHRRDCEDAFGWCCGLSIVSGVGLSDSGENLQRWLGVGRSATGGGRRSDSDDDR